MAAGADVSMTSWIRCKITGFKITGCNVTGVTLIRPDVGLLPFCHSHLHPPRIHPLHSPHIHPYIHLTSILHPHHIYPTPTTHRPFFGPAWTSHPSCIHLTSTSSHLPHIYLTSTLQRPVIDPSPSSRQPHISRFS